MLITIITYIAIAILIIIALYGIFIATFFMLFKKTLKEFEKGMGE